MKPDEWPGLGSLRSNFPIKFTYERAIWGKIDGARTDFRWIARSADFSGHRKSIERALTIGSEDRPRKAPLWLHWEGSYYAVSCYASRAKDAAGRTGFLEKQIAEWQPDGNPATLAALAILPHVATFNDDLSMSTSKDFQWADPGFSLSLKSSECVVTADTMRAAISEGCNALGGLDQSLLQKFFSDLIDGHGVALLENHSGPLTPEALATLLLVLPEHRASALSLCGWIPSDRVDLRDLQNWHGAVCISRGQVRGAEPSSPSSVTLNQARSIVSVLQNARLEMSDAEIGFVNAILEFARGPKRWLQADELHEPTETSYAATMLLKNAVQQAEQEAEVGDLPDGSPDEIVDARRRHLRAKADVIRAAAMLTNPEIFRPQNPVNRLQDIFNEWLGTPRGVSGNLERRIRAAINYL